MNRRSFTRGLVVSSAVSLAPLAAMQRANAQDATAEISAEPQLPVTVTDVNGNDITIEDVSRIVPLNGASTETLFALGLGDNVVATDVSSLYPEEAVGLPSIGYVRELSAEGILSFAPTLVIGTTEAGPEDVLAQVSDAGVPMLILEAPRDPEGAAGHIREIATAVGLPEAGEELASGVTAQLEEASELAATSGDEPRVAFLYIRGQGTQTMAGTDVAADGVITAAGGINVGAELGIDGYQPITPESLVTAAPDVILLMQAGLASVGGVEGLMEIPGIAETPAGMNERFVSFEDLYLLGFGPRIGESIYDLTIAIHDDIDEEPLNPQWQGLDVELPDTEATPAS